MFKNTSRRQLFFLSMGCLLILAAAWGSLYLHDEGRSLLFHAENGSKINSRWPYVALLLLILGLPAMGTIVFGLLALFHRATQRSP
jgi:hypothetical protein